MPVISASFARMLLTSFVIASTLTAGGLFCAPLQPNQNCTAHSWTSQEDKADLYVMGKTVCKAVILHERGDAVGAQREFNKAQSIAAEFGLTLPPLPRRSNDAKKQLDWAATYSLGSMKPIYQELDEKYQPYDSTICQLACKTTMLRMMYEPGEEMSVIVSQILERDAPSALPPKAWQPVVEAIKAKKPKADAMKALDNMDAMCALPASYKLPGVVSGLSVRKRLLPPGVQARLKANANTGGGGGGGSGGSGGGGVGSGGIWGSFGALSGKPSPIAPPNASGSPGKVLTNRGQKFQLYNFGRFTAMVCNMTVASKTFPQKDVDEVYGFCASTAKQFQIPLTPQPKRTGTSKVDAKAANDYWIQQMHDANVALETRYGATERYVFDLGLNAHLLQSLYEPTDPKIPATDENLDNKNVRVPATEALILVFKTHGAEAMPERIWKPFVDAIDRRAPISEVDKRLKEMDDQVEAWFLPKSAAPRN